MAIVLPASPLPQSANPKPIDYGAWQASIAGGRISRLDRLGNRFSMDVVIPKLKPEPDGRIWVSRLVDAIGGDVQMAFPQVGLVIDDPGSPVIDGGGQAGNAVAIRGLPAGYTIREGQFFNLYDAGGRPYLYKASGSDQVADGSGNIVLQLPPSFLIRVTPANGSPVNLFPVIAGQLSGNTDGWTLERAGTRGLKFTITERV